MTNWPMYDGEWSAAEAGNKIEKPIPQPQFELGAIELYWRFVRCGRGIIKEGKKYGATNNVSDLELMYMSKDELWKVLYSIFMKSQRLNVINLFFRHLSA